MRFQLMRSDARIARKSFQKSNHLSLKTTEIKQNHHTRYVALLRGINVGGNKTVKMEELKKALELLGYKNVTTILNSGNVLFETVKTPDKTLVASIEKQLKTIFGFEIGVMVRSEGEIKDLAKKNPFKGVQVTSDTRLYVTFLSQKPTSTLRVPYESPEKDFKILSTSSGDVCSVLTISARRNSTDAMKILEKEFGKKITTRNWNTVERILKKW